MEWVKREHMIFSRKALVGKLYMYMGTSLMAFILENASNYFRDCNNSSFWVVFVVIFPHD